MHNWHDNNIIEYQLCKFFGEGVFLGVLSRVKELKEVKEVTGVKGVKGVKDNSFANKHCLSVLLQLTYTITK